MTRSRVVTFLVVLALSGVGLTVLMAAKDAGDRSPAPAGRPDGDRKSLVCLGTVDTEEPVVRIFPDNFPLPSKVIRVLVKEGAEVTSGQPLLEFDDQLPKLKVQEAENAIKGAQAEQAKAQATLDGHKPQVDSLEKELQAKEEVWKSKRAELDEVKRLFDQGVKVKTKLELEAAEAAARAAELDVQAARIKWQGLKDIVPNFLVDLAKENVEHKKTLKAQAENVLAQLACKAPADGWIIRSFVSEGMTFGPHSKEPAFWFVKKGPLLVRAEVPQEFARRVKLGATATIKDEADAEQSWTGRVVKVGDQFLPKRNAGGTLDLMMVGSDERVLESQVSIDPPAPGKDPPRFGQKVRVYLQD